MTPGCTCDPAHGHMGDMCVACRAAAVPGGTHTPPAPPPTPKADAAPKREGKVDRRG